MSARPNRSPEVSPPPPGTHIPGGRANAILPGLLLIQVDGLSASDLEYALGQGIIPTVSKLVREGHRLQAWSSGLPSDTLAVQTSLFWGAEPPVPSFEWWDRRHQRRRHAASASGAATIERTLEAEVGPGLLRGGQCHGAAIGGGAYGGTLLPPTGRRTWLSMAGESVRAIAHVVSVRQPPHSSPTRRPRTEALGPDRPTSLGSRAVALAVAAASRASGHIVASGAHRDLASGRPIIFVNVVEYDLVAHLTGPRSEGAREALTSIDALVGSLVNAAREAPRPYRVIVISDHGVAPATPIPTLFTPDIRTWVTDEWKKRTRTNDTLAVTASGTVLQAWVRDTRERQDLHALALRAPGFVEAIARHPAIALTIVADGIAGGGVSHVVVIGRDGGVRLVTNRRSTPGAEFSERPPVVVERWGESPFARLGRPDEVEAHVAAFAGRPDLGDVACLAAPTRSAGDDHDNDEFWTFESQYGAHGGLGGDQARPFLLIPPDDPGPTGLHGGASAIHSWLESLAPPR